MKTITIIGGGSSAHVLIPLLSKTGMKVNLMTRSPEKWANVIQLDYQKTSGEIIDTFEGELSRISAYAAEVIPDSDIIILCMPVHAYRLSLHAIAPYINKNKKVFVGTVYGQAGFNWMTEEISREFSLEKITTFAFGLIPWICRTAEYGKKGIIYGAKPLNIAAVHPKEDFDELNEKLFSKITYDWFEKGEFRQADNFLSLTLSADNQIIHTARLFGLFLEEGGVWDEKIDVPYFYRDFTKKSADILKDLDEDFSLIRNRIIEMCPDREFTFMLDYMALDRNTNMTENVTVLDTFRNSESLDAIKTPVIKVRDKWMINKNNRFFLDDIFYGLCIVKSLAEKLEIPVIHIDGLLDWTQQLLGEKIIEVDKLVIWEQVAADRFKFGVPEAYGYTMLTQIID